MFLALGRTRVGDFMSNGAKNRVDRRRSNGRAGSGRAPRRRAGKHCRHMHAADTLTRMDVVVFARSTEVGGPATWTAVARAGVRRRRAGALPASQRACTACVYIAGQIMQCYVRALPRLICMQRKVPSLIQITKPTGGKPCM